MKRNVAFYLFLFFNLKLFSQVITSSFIAPDTVCVGQTFTIQNTSTGSINSTYWNFCSASSTLAQALNIGTNTAFSNPVFASIHIDGGNYIMFVSNNATGNLTRLVFGNSLNNIPVITNLGNLGGNMPLNGEGLFIEKEGSNWYGVILGGPNGLDRIVRLNFGNSLMNLPTAINMGNIGAMSYPHRLQIVHAGGFKYGFTINRSNSTITRFDFGNSLNNVPAGTNLGNIGSLQGPSDFALVNVNGNWHMFITNDGNNTITRLDFGNNLLSTPTGTNLGNPGLNIPRGISIDVNCNGISGQVSTLSNGYFNMTFPSGPTGPINLTNIGNIGGFSFPHALEKYRVMDTVFCFITNASSASISRLKYVNCVSIPSSTLQTLNTTSFPSAGVYTISLHNNSNQYNQSVYCKTIAVVANSITAFASSTIGCNNSGFTTTLSVSGAGSFTWEPGSIVGSTVVVSPTISTIYTVSTTSSLTCGNINTISIQVIPTPSLVLNVNSATVCSGNSLNLNASGASSFTWNPGAIMGNSIVITPTSSSIYTVTGSDGICSDSKTIQINVNPSPDLGIGATPLQLCAGESSTLTASGANSYTWNPGSSNNSSLVTSPTITTTYSLIGSIGSCSAQTSIQVSVTPIPSISIVPNTSSLCSGYSQIFIASGADTYTWLPNATIGNSLIITPTTNTTYTIIGANNNCIDTKTISLFVYPTPTLQLNSSAGGACIEYLQNATLTASGANTYTWYPVPFTQASVIVNPSVSIVYTVTGSNTFSCEASNTIQINVTPNLQSSISNSVICKGSSVQLKANGADYYNWFPILQGGNELTIFPELSTTYTVQGGSGPCVKENYLSVEVLDNPIVEIPEVITPNDDGKNDRFEIKTKAPAKMDIKVFNRWGAPVYTNSEYDNSWDGTSNNNTPSIGKGKLPQGTYYFVITIESCINKVITGFVVIQY